jgi:hypothetical protein
MPLSRDAKGGGSNVDGSISATYCSHCFAEGAFAMPGLTLSEMQDRVREKLRSRGLSQAAIEALVAGIAELERWR